MVVARGTLAVENVIQYVYVYYVVLPNDNGYIIYSRMRENPVAKRSMKS